jgi:diadenosine tetraphosphate (Ap4A) HIT family hydrolase
MTQPEFTLDHRLQTDTLHVADWPLCRVLLINDARFPWLVLVPMRAGISEMLDLEPDDRRQLTAEIDRAAAALRRTVTCDKLNIAALGNMVSQLHVHVIARRRSDAAWPKPVWGQGTPEAYEDEAARALLRRLNDAFAG